MSARLERRNQPGVLPERVVGDTRVGYQIGKGAAFLALRGSVTPESPNAEKVLPRRHLLVRRDHAGERSVDPVFGDVTGARQEFGREPSARQRMHEDQIVVAPVHF